MIFPLLVTLVLLLATFVAGAVLWLLLQLLPRGRRPGRRYWWRLAWLHLALLPLHLLVTFPCALGFVGSRWIGTRGDEVGYQGPRLLPDGALQIQNAASLKQERLAGTTVAADVLAAAAARARTIPSSDGVVLRAFRLEANVSPPRAVVVLVHGLFRSALELEPPAAMFHRAGCECWLLELRNHGGSTRAPFTAGLRESDDVVAAVAYVRQQPGCSGLPLVLFGCSLGTAAVSLALPRIADVAGVVLDAPLDDVTAAAHRTLGFQRRGDGRSFFRLWPPLPQLVCFWLQQWSRFDLGAIRPGAVLQSLPTDLPLLVVGGGNDDRAPPDSVAALFAGLPMADGNKELWLRPGSGHGRVWLDDPSGYEQRLRALLVRLRRAGGSR